MPDRRERSRSLAAARDRLARRRPHAVRDGQTDHAQKICRTLVNHAADMCVAHRKCKHFGLSIHALGVY